MRVGISVFEVQCAVSLLAGTSVFLCNSFQVVQFCKLGFFFLAAPTFFNGSFDDRLQRRVCSVVGPSSSGALLLWN